MSGVMKEKIGENVVQNSVLPSSQLLRSIGNLIFISMTRVQVCHHAFPTKNLETTKRARTEPREGFTQACSQGSSGGSEEPLSWKKGPQFLYTSPNFW